MTASPGITLYFTPAWMTFGLTVSRVIAAATRATEASHGSSASSAVTPPSPRVTPAIAARRTGAASLRVRRGPPAPPARTPAPPAGARRGRDAAARAGTGLGGGAAPRRASLRGEEPDDPELHGDEILHVHGATAVHVAVRHVRA